MITGGGYAKLKERQGSKELLDPGTISASKTSADGVDEGPMSESKGEQSSATPGRQSVGLLAGTARLMKRAVATADRYKQFIDADVDAEAAPIASSDCEADGHSDESSDAEEPNPSQADFQYTELDDAGHHSMKPSLPHFFTPATSATTSHANTAAQQPVAQIQKFPVDDGHDKCTVRRRPVKPDFSVHASTANPFSLGKIQPPMTYDTGASTGSNSAPLCHDKVDVFGAAPFRRKVVDPADSRTESADNIGTPDVFANVPFVRQQERVAKATASVSPPATSKVVYMPNSALSSDVGSYGTFSPTESYNTSGAYLTSSAGFNQSASGPMTAAFVPSEPVSTDGHTHFDSTLSSAIPPYGVEAQEMSVNAQQGGGPLLASLPLSVAGDCLDQQSCTSKASLHFPPDAAQSMHEEPQAAEECHGSLKRSWLAKLRSEKESPTTAVANLGFSDDPDAILPTSALSAATDRSFHEDMLDAAAEPKSPAVTSESNFLLPSGEGSHTLPKVGAKKHLSHQHHAPLMPPETESFSVTKKGIALL